MIFSKNWKSGVAAILLLFVLSLPAQANINPGDAQTLTTCLDVLRQRFEPVCESTALSIVRKQSYSADDLVTYFQSYFASHRLNENLYFILTAWMYNALPEADKHKISTALIQVAEGQISGVFQNHPSNLGQFLAGSQAERDNLVFFMRLLARVGVEGVGTLDKQAVYTWARQTILNNSQYLATFLLIDPISQPYVNFVRMQMQVILRDTVGLTSAVKADIAATLQLSGARLRLWNTYSALVYDNQFFNARDFDFIQALWDAIPAPLALPKNLSVNDAMWPLGAQQLFPTARAYVNVFKLHVGEASENGFPNDVVPFFNDLAAGAILHESNHIVDCFCPDGYLNNDSSFRARKELLINQAGRDRLNYLRSILPDGFFADAPQEFFASISNMYLVNTELTLEVGRLRLEQFGRHQPLEQFLFFMDVYSRHTNVSRGYRIGMDGQVISYDIPLQRNGNLLTGFSLLNNDYTITYGIDSVVKIEKRQKVTISPSSQSFSSSGGAGSINVTGGPWTAVSNASWIRLTSGGSGNGNGAVNYAVSLNNGIARVGTITIEGNLFTVIQAGCATLSPTSQIFGTNGGIGQVAVNTSGGCSWTAISGTPWITVLSGSSGSGNGMVRFSVEAFNGIGSRTGFLTIAGETFTVTQSSFSCLPSIIAQPSSGSISSGQTATLTVTATGVGILAGSLTYQWYKGQSGNTANLIPGATASFYTTPPLTTTTDYWVRVSNACGSVNSATATITVAQLNNAVFISQSVPVSMVAGRNYTVFVIMRNTGASSWSLSSYRLASQNPPDNTTWGRNRASLPGSVAPGAQVTISFTVTAPARPGTYNFQWQMVQEGGGLFGSLTPNLLVRVVP